jgi:hypothetical protein
MIMPSGNPNYDQALFEAELAAAGNMASAPATMATPMMQQPQPQQVPMYQPPEDLSMMDRMANYVGNGPQGDFYAERGLINPQAARFGSMMNNIYAISQGAMPGINPAMAYAQAVAQNAAAVRERRQSDPFYEFEEGRRRGYIPEDMTLADYRQSKYRAPSAGLGSTAPIKNFERWRQLNPDATPEEQRQVFERMVRADSVVGIGGGGQVARGGLTGSTELLVDPEDATQRDAYLAGQKVASQEWAKIDSSFGQEYSGAVQGMAQVINTTQDLIDMIEQNPNMDTGMFEGLFSPRTDELVSRLDTLSTLMTVPALAEAKLQPVTEQEFESIKSTFASARNDPEANLASLRAQLEWMIPRLLNLRQANQFYQENGRSLRGYSGSQDLDSLIEETLTRASGRGRPNAEGQEVFNLDLPPLPEGR